MNIYSLLMASNKGDTFFPKLPAKDIIRGTSSYASKKHSTEKITKRSIDKDNRNLRTTYYDIVQIPHFPGTLGMGSVASSKTETIKQQQEMKTTQTCIKKCQSPELFKINGYEVIKEIGKGGFAEVFQCINEQGQKFAIKQYVLTNSPECYKNECIVGEHFFERGKLRSKFAQKRGGSNLIGFQEKIKNGKKGYIVQEIGGKSLSKTISDIQGVFHKGERVYEVKFSKFYEELVFQKKLKSLMIQIAEGIKLLNFEGYIHCDLKPENILVNQTENGNYIYKIIDFGSAFRLEEGLPKITITPQYMPPELLEELSSSGMYQQPSRNSDSFSSSVNKGMSRLNKIDIWSLGCVLLQILTGVPLWFRYKCKISLSRSGKEYLQLGFFALTNRQYHKIVKKQKEICLNLKKINFVYNELEIYRGILNRMLVFDPSQRASIDEILSLLQKLP